MTTLSASISRFRWMFLLAAISVLAVTSLADDATAWTSEDLVPAEKEYRSAFVYYWTTEYFRGEYVQPSYTSIPISGNYRGYMSYPVSHLDDMSHIESASLTVVARNSGTFTLNVRIMDREIHQLDPEIAFTSIYQATSAGTVSISTGLAYRTYTVSITGTALDELRDIIAGDNEYLVMAFDHASLGWVDLFARYIDLSGTYYSTLDLEYDNEAPEVPILTAMDEFIIGDHVTTSWSPVADLPSGGNRGDVTYQVGVFLPDAPADNPYYLGSWADVTSWNLTGVADNVTYTFRVRARDGSNFTSDWSAPVNTTIDNSPPTVPWMPPLPRYTSGGDQNFYLNPSIDFGVGGIIYNFQISTHPRFFWQLTTDFNNSEPRISLDHLDSTQPYYYRVRAIDALGHASSWSNPVWSQYDYQPPSIPIMFEEPSHTKADWNAFEWHPSVDAGVGVDHYVYEVALSSSFTQSHYSRTTSFTNVTVRVLDNAVTYYFRVRSVDAFGHMSDWSSEVHSTQDYVGPSQPQLHPLPQYIPEGPITISWTPSHDKGVGLALYDFSWSFDPTFRTTATERHRVLGQSFTIPDLTAGVWYFRISALDAFYWSSIADVINTTVDATPPTTPVLESLPEVSPGTSINVSWSEATDNESGVDHYVLEVFTSSGPSGLHLTYTTNEINLTVDGLQDGHTYWYRVTAVDGVGNAVSSAVVHSTQDASPPPRPTITRLPEYYSVENISFYVIGEPDAGGGPLEHQVRWRPVWPSGVSVGAWEGVEDWIELFEVTVEGLSDGTYEFCGVTRDARGWVSEPSEIVTTTIDLTHPRVAIVSPDLQAHLAGVVSVECSVDEDNLEYVTLFYNTGADGSWVRVAERADVGVYLFSFTWVTTTVPDGSYWIKVLAYDRVGWHGSAEMRVGVWNARLSIDPEEFSLSDPSPVDGDEVTLKVPVHNMGDGLARNVSVSIYLDGELVGQVGGLDIPAHDELVVEHNFTARDGQELTAEVHGTYETPPMTTGYIVRTEEVEEAPDEEGGALGLVLGALALVISLMALLLALSTRRMAPAKDMGEWEERGD